MRNRGRDELLSGVIVTNRIARLKRGLEGLGQELGGVLLVCQLSAKVVATHSINSGEK